MHVVTLILATTVSDNGFSLHPYQFTWCLYVQIVLPNYILVVCA